MGHRWHKFCLLIWKNWLLQKRHKVQTIVEVMAPVMFAGIIVLIRAMVVPEARGQMQHKKINASNFYAGLYTYIPQEYDVVPLHTTNFVIAYAPQTPKLTSVMNQSLQYLLSSNGVIPFEPALKHLNGFSETSQMMEYLTDPRNTETVVCGVEFGKSFIGSDWPEDMEMTMHFAADLTTVLETRSAKHNWKTGFMYPSSQVPGPRNPLSKTGGPPGYFDEGFVPLVHAICREITMAISGKRFPLVTVQRLPHPKYVSDSMISIMKGYLALILVISFNYNCINTVKSVAMEKERQLKEVMKIMGLDNWLHWTAWFIKTFSYNMLSILLMCFVFKVEWYSEGEGISDHSVFTFTPWHVILVFMVLYMITSVCFCLMLSVFFSKANTAATVAGMIWFMSFSPFMVMKNDKLILPLNLRLAACLSSNAAMGFGFKIILENEATGAGIPWANMWTPTTVEDPMVLAHVMLMLAFDAVLYMLIALYVEQVFPGSYGVPQHFWFPLSIYFWRSICGCPKIYKDTEEEVEKNEDLEPDPEGLALGINIIRLTKKYGKKVVVDKLTFKIFQDQITVVLGHNGAGKTTAMSMLTGMFPPTSGTAVVMGHDIVTDIKGVRASIGICPQHDVLFAELTVAEHIYFYAKLKGLSGKALSEEVDKYVSLLALDAKRNVRSSALSGGMQRRLSVGTALCGGSSVILLDEPSSGMDPAARRHLWDLLHAEKKGRTIILSTHFMDEAEVLGDRVAIMSAGRLAAVGSPFFLKNQFGSGYQLTAATKGLPSAPITELIQGYIPKAQLHSEVGSEICYTLPQNEVNNFQPMLADLESKQKSLGLASFGLSAATLEDVFMKVGADAVETTDDKGKMTFQESGTDESEKEPEKEPPDNAEAGKETYECHKGCRLYCGQWWAMLYKKILVTFSTLLFSVMQIVVPVMILMIAVVMSKLWITNDDLPSLELSMSKTYTDSVTLVHSDSKDKDTETRIDKYKDYFAEAKISTMKVVDTGSKSVEDYYLEEAKTNLPLMRTRNLVGATFKNKKSVTAWFSNFGLHDLPVSLVLIHNAILKSESPKKSYKVINKPLPFRLESKLELTSGSGEIDNAGFQVAFHIGFAMSFVAAFYVMFCIKENMCRSKLLQLASGASPFIMWGAAFVWDLLCYMLVVLAMTITLFLSNLVGFATPGEIGRVVIILIVYGYAALPMHYVASGFFSNGSTGFSVMCLFNVLGGVATFVIVEILSSPNLELTEYGTAFHWTVVIIPSYALCGAIKNFYEASLLLDSCLASCKRYKLSDCDQNVICKLNPEYKKCCLSDYPYFEWEKPGVGQHATFMIIVGSVSFIILLIREYGIANECLRKMRYGKSPAPPKDDEDEDNDVAVERNLVNNLSKDDYKNFSLVLKDMSKSYTNFQAVKKLCLAIKSGECFGLLGINGAGKTTTFKMLTGDHKITSGEAWVKGFSVKNDMKTAYGYIGYCPQFDALLDEMTGRQTLQMFSKLRGIPKVNQKKFVWDLSKNLGYVKHLDKKVREYSGGNKRKLSTSVALLGDPEVVYLDEPTTSMDPMAKRQVWKALVGRKTGSVVLTSHSMEECEALCTRLAIMVNGRFRCIGSTHHLKNKFSKGYTLIVMVRRRKSRLEIDSDKPNLDKVGWNLGNLTEDWLTKTSAGKELLPIEGRKRRSTMFNKEPLHLFILRTFPGATLKESYQGKMTYYLPDKNMTWSKIFGIMEKAKKELDIEDYSIGQTSLEQVFLQFTKEQKGNDD